MACVAFHVWADDRGTYNVDWTGRVSYTEDGLLLPPSECLAMEDIEAVLRGEKALAYRMVGQGDGYARTTVGAIDELLAQHGGADAGAFLGELGQRAEPSPMKPSWVPGTEVPLWQLTGALADGVVAVYQGTPGSEGPRFVSSETRALGVTDADLAFVSYDYVPPSTDSGSGDGSGGGSWSKGGQQ